MSSFSNFIIYSANSYDKCTWIQLVSVFIHFCWWTEMLA